MSAQDMNTVKTMPASRAGSDSSRGNGGTAVTPDKRNEMIALAAYYRAQQRGFEGGSELEDWLQAEREVDAMIAGMPGTSQSAGGTPGATTAAGAPPSNAPEQKRPVRV